MAKSLWTDCSIFRLLIKDEEQLGEFSDAPFCEGLREAVKQPIWFSPLVLPD